MNEPTPIEIAAVAAPLLAAMGPSRASCADAVTLARLLIAEASKVPPAPRAGRLVQSVEAAKRLGYVSRNWRGQLRDQCVKLWPVVSAQMPAVVAQAYPDGAALFDHYDARGWEESLLRRLAAAKAAALTASRKRPKKRQLKSRAK